jgi:hypothetical protein
MSRRCRACLPTRALAIICRRLRALRLAVQDIALSRRKHGFESRRARQYLQALSRKRRNQCPGSVPPMGSREAVVVRLQHPIVERSREVIYELGRTRVAGCFPVRRIEQADSGQAGGGTDCGRETWAHRGSSIMELCGLSLSAFIPAHATEFGSKTGSNVHGLFSSRPPVVAEPESAGQEELWL